MVSITETPWNFHNSKTIWGVSSTTKIYSSFSFVKWFEIIFGSRMFHRLILEVFGRQTTCWIYFQWKVRSNDSSRIAFDDHRWAWILAHDFRVNRGTFVSTLTATVKCYATSGSMRKCGLELHSILWRDFYHLLTSVLIIRAAGTIKKKNVIIIVCDHEAKLRLRAQYYRRYFQMVQLYVNLSNALYKYKRLASMVFSIIDPHRSIINSIDWQWPIGRVIVRKLWDDERFHDQRLIIHRFFLGYHIAAKKCNYVLK